jgi:hypothetical protein
MYSVSFVQNPKIIVQTECKVNDCTILEKFVNNLKLTIPPDNNILNVIVNWFQRGLISLNDVFKSTTYSMQNFTVFWTDINACNDLIKDELQKRKEHLEKCVCLSNKGHTTRINKLLNASQLFDAYMQSIIAQICFKDNMYFLNANLSKFYVIFKYTNDYEKYKKEFQAEITNIINTHKTFDAIIIDSNGDVKMDGSLTQLLIFNTVLKKITSDSHYIEHHIQRMLKTALESVYYTLDVFNHNETPYATCIEESASDGIIKVKMNYKQVSNYVLLTKNFDVDPSFLASFVEQHNKILIYKNCFFALIKYQIELVKKLCKSLYTIDIDEDIRDLLINICTMINGNGKNQQGIGWLFKSEMESKIKELVPSLNVTYKHLLSTEKTTRVFKDSSYKATYNVLKDLKHMQEHFIIELFMRFEDRWKSFELEFYTSPKKKLKMN